VAFGEELAGLDGDEAAEVGKFGAEFFAEETDEFAAFGSGDGAPLEKGRVGLSDGLGCVGCADGGELGNDLASEGGAGGQVAVGVSGRGDAEFGEDRFDFVTDGHGLWFLEVA
jgi:hypothetical protein